jgi:hypothetical protein
MKDIQSQPSVVTISITAICIGENVTLLDATGKEFASISARVAREVSPEMQSSIQRDILLLWHEKKHGWPATWRRMRGQHLGKCSRRGRTEWEIKAQGWMASIRWRRNRIRLPRKGNSINGERARSDSETWETACRFFYIKHANILRKKDIRKNDPWRLWAETVYSNHRAKEERNEERRQGISVANGIQGDTREAEIQVCFKWSRNHPEEVFA